MTDSVILFFTECDCIQEDFTILLNGIKVTREWSPEEPHKLSLLTQIPTRLTKKYRLIAV